MRSSDICDYYQSLQRGNLSFALWSTGRSLPPGWIAGNSVFSLSDLSHVIPVPGDSAADDQGERAPLEKVTCTSAEWPLQLQEAA
jgi:hypothetical protein